MNASRLLDVNPHVARHEVLEYKTWSKGYYLKIEAVLNDGSLLAIREYVDPSKRRYSFHWQNRENQIIRRWDNAPHHPHLDTFPHHVHEGNDVKASPSVTLADVLDLINSILAV